MAPMTSSQAWAGTGRWQEGDRSCSCRSEPATARTWDSALGLVRIKWQREPTAHCCWAPPSCQTQRFITAASVPKPCGAVGQPKANWGARWDANWFPLSPRTGLTGRTSEEMCAFPVHMCDVMTSTLWRRLFISIYYFIACIHCYFNKILMMGSDWKIPDTYSNYISIPGLCYRRFR